MREAAVAIAVAAAIVISCRAADQPPVVAKQNDPLLQHHEIRVDRLPPPYETPSAGNSPFVRARPKDAALHVPAGFKVTLWAAGFDDPRNMVYAPNGDIFVAEPGGGKITVLRGGNPPPRCCWTAIRPRRTFSSPRD